MNTKLYRPPEGWPPSPGDTIVLRKRPSPGQPPPPGRGAMVLKVLREEDKSAMLEPNPECPRCKECLTFEQELTSWVCHGCGNVPSTEEVHKIAVNALARYTGSCSLRR